MDKLEQLWCGNSAVCGKQGTERVAWVEVVERNRQKEKQRGMVGTQPCLHPII